MRGEQDRAGDHFDEGARRGHAEDTDGKRSAGKCPACVVSSRGGTLTTKMGLTAVSTKGEDSQRTHTIAS